MKANKPGQPVTTRKGSAVTRRSMVAVLATTASAVAQVTTTVPPKGTPAAAPAEATPEAKLQKAYADVREAGGRLSQISVPMELEPAFTFRA